MIRYGVIVWGGVTGILLATFMALQSEPSSFPLLGFHVVHFLLRGSAWGSVMWDWPSSENGWKLELDEPGSHAAAVIGERLRGTW